MLSKKIVLMLIIILIFIIIIFFKFNPKQNIKTSTIVEQKEIVNYDETCISTKSIKTVLNNSMEPMIKPDEELVLLEGYYECNEVKRGEVVAYNHSGNEYPLIKKVLVLGGDKLEISGDNLMVNDEILKNSIDDPYTLNDKNKKMISLYIEDGCLRTGSYLIFGDNLSSSLDSRNFGAVGKIGFLGKFVIE